MLLSFSPSYSPLPFYTIVFFFLVLSFLSHTLCSPLSHPPGSYVCSRAYAAVRARSCMCLWLLCASCTLSHALCTAAAICLSSFSIACSKSAISSCVLSLVSFVPLPLLSTLFLFLSVSHVDASSDVPLCCPSHPLS